MKTTTLSPIQFGAVFCGMALVLTAACGRSSPVGPTAVVPSATAPTSTSPSPTSGETPRAETTRVLVVPASLSLGDRTVATSGTAALAMTNNGNAPLTFTN